LSQAQPAARRHGAWMGTIVVLHESHAVLELVEQTLRDRGDVVFATRDPFEALDVVRRIQVDLLILDGQDGLERDLRTIQPFLRVVRLEREPVSLHRLRETVAAELAPGSETA